MDSIHAEVAELVDALASGASGRKPVEVQVLSSVPFIYMASQPVCVFLFLTVSFSHLVAVLELSLEVSFL